MKTCKFCGETVCDGCGKSRSFFDRNCKRIDFAVILGIFVMLWIIGKNRWIN